MVDLIITSFGWDLAKLHSTNWYLCYLALSARLLRNASISMNPETVGERTVKFEDKALREGIIHMLNGNSSKPV